MRGVELGKALSRVAGQTHVLNDNLTFCAFDEIKGTWGSGQVHPCYLEHGFCFTSMRDRTQVINGNGVTVPSLLIDPSCIVHSS